MRLGPFTVAPEKMTMGVLIGALFAWLSFYLIGSYVTLCAINSLFPALNIPVTWETVFAAFWLTALINATVGSSK